jgi:type I restriction enzyme S subunit
VSFPRYPAYKDSGVEWLGRIPADWGVLPTKRLFARKKDLNTGMICEDRLALTMAGVVSRDLDDLEGLQASEFETYQIFESDDLAFKLIDLQNIKTSRVGIVPRRGIMSPAYIRLQPNAHGVLPRFGYWFFTNLYFQRVFNELGGGVRQTIGPEELLALSFAQPSIGEQGAIAGFLDCETAKIDALVAEQERLIALLKEKRQAVISHAVTKGLNPDAPMKPSGIEWLGEVPAHWEVCPVKVVAAIGNGATPNRDRLDYWEDGEYPWLSSTVVNQDIVREATEFVTRAALEECHLPKVQPPAVLIGITGEGKTRGMATMLGMEATINQHIAFVKPERERVDPAYLHRYFEMAYLRMRFESDGGGSTKGAITCQQIAQMRMPLPPKAEQEAIAGHVAVRADQTARLVGEADRAIALLKERRSALISAAVTGQIDVRGLAA